MTSLTSVLVVIPASIQAAVEIAAAALKPTLYLKVTKAILETSSLFRTY